MTGTVCLTFDVDGGEAQRYAAPGEPALVDLSQISWGDFGIVRGLPRILELLRELAVPGTFFSPGATLDAHPEAFEAVLADGHEIGHHGHHHFHPAEIDAAAQEEELLSGLEAIRRRLGVTPAGYRSPAWQLTSVTFELLVRHGFVYDSSLMGDDRPYVATDGPHRLLELPVHWGLDDFPHFGMNASFAGPLRNPREVFDVWWLEIESAIADGRPTVLCMHPEVIGRSWTFDAFGRFVRRLTEDHRIELRTCLDVARSHTDRQ
jgi:peptidoglycan-N-acetylglucosamine deacetylase